MKMPVFDTPVEITDITTSVPEQADSNEVLMLTLNHFVQASILKSLAGCPTVLSVSDLY